MLPLWNRSLKGNYMTSGRALALIQIAVISTFITSCSNTKDDKSHRTPQRSAEPAIRAASDDWGKAMSARDVDKTISFYAEDSSYLPNRHPVIKKKDELREFWVQLFAQPGPGFQCDTTRVEVARSGELAYETGTCELTTNDATWKPRTERQKYLVVWKKQSDASWKAAVDIDNTD